MSSVNTSFVGSVPENYDRFLGPMLFEPYAADLVARIKNHKISSILELACGTGRVTNHLQKLFPDKVKIIATDLNPDMLSIAKAKVPAASIQWLPADMQALPFGNEEFDVVICQFGIMFVPDKAKAFKEASRVVKKGGSFHFNTWDKIEHNGVPSVAHKVVTEFFNNNPPVFYTIPFSMYRPEELKDLSLKNGFSDVKIERISKVGRSDSANDAARGMVEGSPIFKEIMDKDAKAIGPVVERVTTEIAVKFGNEPVICPLQAWVCEATKNTPSTES